MIIDLADRQISCTRRGGSGAPLLLIMGMAGHQGLWREDFLARLDRDFEVVTYDHRGIGDSTDVPGDFTIAELADDAAAVLDAVGWRDAHVFGISMGGMIAQELTLRHPARVRRLVLGCTYCGGPDSLLTAAGPIRMLEAMNAGVAEDAFRASFGVNLSASYTADESHWPEFHDLAVAERVPVSVVMRQAQAAFGHDTSSRLPSITAPTLVIAGTADEMLAYANAELIASLIPDAKLYPLPEVGHLFWWERPEETAAALREHLLGLRSGAPQTPLIIIDALWHDRGDDQQTG
jgi:3-oxoadipate enol-lactonase